MVLVEKMLFAQAEESYLGQNAIISIESNYYVVQ